MLRAVEIARYLIHHARAALELMGELEDETGLSPQQRDLIAWIRRRGGDVSPAELTRGPKRFRMKGGSELAVQELEQLCELGVGRWILEWERRPGAPSRRFRLFEDGEGGGAEGGETPPGEHAKNGSSAPPPTSAPQAKADAPDPHANEERAAIHEYDAGLPRAEAERAAGIAACQSTTTGLDSEAWPRP
jgi:hypothetical protein